MLNTSAEASTVYQPNETPDPRKDGDAIEPAPAPPDPDAQIVSLCEPWFSTEERIWFILSYIDGHLEEDLSVRRLARLCGRSLSHFRASFLLQTKATPGRYIKNLRLRKAAEMLTAERLTLPVVMRRVGLRDKSHFMRDFKACFGITPGNYHRTQLRRRRALQRAAIVETAEPIERG
jgi:transcriptional regulator GlxA family with amidase domain